MKGNRFGGKYEGEREMDRVRVLRSSVLEQTKLEKQMKCKAGHELISVPTESSNTGVPSRSGLCALAINLTSNQINMSNIRRSQSRMLKPFLFFPFATLSGV
ncbi:hypothetical protein ElyMa_003252200 [Elysia marginata]|uniref:Uncharacterized protein n=1 Tax=Elysia marginata TaxID=1093978 RepID=A0AAV4J6H3_9GAST|nr:hypothetical protein ElyMa_003252200 [Elysia marginata]